MAHSLLPNSFTAEFYTKTTHRPHLIKAAGMCLLDTAYGGLMMTLYTSAALARDQIAVLYYSIVLTVITIIVSIVIGTIQLLSLIRSVAEPTGRFWDGVELLKIITISLRTLSVFLLSSSVE